MKLKRTGYNLLVMGVITGGLSGLWYLWLYNPAIADENHLLEWTQVFFLSAAMLVCLIRMGGEDKGEKTFPFGFLFLVFLSAILREVDVEDFPLPDPVILMGSGMGRDIMLTVAWLVYLFFLLRNYHRLPGISIQYLNSHAGRYFMAGTFCYLATISFDKNMLTLGPSISFFGEEALEVVATFLLFLSTLRRETLRR